MEDVAALRAGEGSVWARRHITTCEVCQRALEGLYQRVAQLKALPSLRPPRDRWPQVMTIMRAERARKRRTWGAWGGSLAAAAVLAAILLMQPGQSTQLYAELNQAKQQSATLEDSLKQYDIDGRVLSGHAAAVVADLEDRISAIDGHLAQPRADADAQDALLKLWQERVGLMRELVNARATRARYVGL